MDKNEIEKAGTEDDEALDILWSMVMEEGNESAMKSLDGESARTMLKSHAAFSAMLDMNESSVLEDEMNGTDHADLASEENAENMEEEKGAMPMEKPSTPLPGVMDFTPESALISADTWKQIKIVVSCSAPLPEKPEKWERLLALVKVKRRSKWSAELAVKRFYWCL